MTLDLSEDRNAARTVKPTIPSIVGAYEAN